MRKPIAWLQQVRFLQGGLPAVLLAILIGAPIAVVISAPWHTDAPEWGHIASELLPGHLAGTLQLLGGVLLVAFLIAVPSAWLVSAYRFPLSRVFRWALVLPLALPTYISAYTYAALLGPTGSLTIPLHDHLGIRPDVVNLPGLSWILGMVLFPYIYLPARAAFSRGLSAPLDAARLLGRNAVDRFRLVAFPLARPAIVGGAMLVMMETLNDYGAVKYYGVRTLTTGIFRSWGGLYDLGSALRLGMVLLGLVLLLLWIERRSRKGVVQATDQTPMKATPLRGAAAWAAVAWCALVLFFAALLPLGKLSMDVWDGLARPIPARLLPALGGTLQLAALAAATILLSALVFSFLQRHAKRSLGLTQLTILGYAVPGAVIAVGVMVIAAWVDDHRLFSTTLIGSMGLLIYAFTVRFLAVGAAPLQGAMRQQPRSLDEAAKLLGASSWRIFHRINMPLLRPAIAAAAILVAIDVMKELPLTLILRPFGLDTLSTLTYEQASIEQLREASWPALLIVICGLVPVLLLEKLLARYPR